MTLEPMLDCYKWPRRCSHFDDLECLEAEQALEPPVGTAA